VCEELITTWRCLEFIAGLMFDGLIALTPTSTDDFLGLSESSVTGLAGTRLDLSKEISLTRVEVVCVWFTLSRVSVTGIP
jgi:hypothetical protein